MMKIGFLLLSAVLALTACEESEEDVLARTACEHFHNVAGDADILSDSEMREKLKEVYETADNSEDGSVRSAARSMLAAFTDGDVSEFEDAVASMSDACDPYRG